MIPASSTLVENRNRGNVTHSIKPGTGRDTCIIVKHSTRLDILSIVNRITVRNSNTDIPRHTRRTTERRARLEADRNTTSRSSTSHIVDSRQQQTSSRSNSVMLTQLRRSRKL